MRRRIRYRKSVDLAVLALAFVLLAVLWLGADAGEEPAAPPERAVPVEEPKGDAEWTPPRFAERAEERQALAAKLQTTYDFEDGAVLQALRAVPRHMFVPRRQARRAYEDIPLPIGHGQTISQPYIVAEMTRLLELKPGAKVLEIGTGSGYQAAVLAEFTPEVYSVEIIEGLAETAAERLKRLGYSPVKVKQGDGYFGWSEHGPFDAIIVTCATGQIPPPLIRQLAKGGRMVIPVGPVHAVQSLMLVEKDEEGSIRSRSVMAVRFVPLTRGSGGRE